MSDESVSLWIEGIKQGDAHAAEQLWNQYFHRLVGLGRRVLRNSSRRVSDEEDVALSTFKSLCVRAREDRFPQLNDREDLWKLLVTITVRKAGRDIRRDNRGGVNEQSFIQDQLASAAPTPEFAAEMEDAVDGLLARLNDERLKQIAMHKLDGLTNAEIAAELERSISFVERKLQLIRQIWSGDEATESRSTD